MSIYFNNTHKENVAEEVNNNPQGGMCFLLFEITT